ncbi:hypothetical protein HYFRA_00009486 [Hymenoscyphus fraxineus]|uniref:Uncharacterized protein n=1 Tax=Hymenoscyphus fraxineus TaxID=746836 RepID=A0A9N9L0U1_9HELO|nr:hypothetical protein HYFRA_00009486 [Hymenoscyphus fraxineus]
MSLPLRRQEEEWRDAALRNSQYSRGSWFLIRMRKIPLDLSGLPQSKTGQRIQDYLLHETIHCAPNNLPSLNGTQILTANPGSSDLVPRGI